jgi:hypothetical protein
MRHPTNHWRSAALGGVLYLVAYGLWLLPTLAQGSSSVAAGASDLGKTYLTLVWVQALALVILAPAVGVGRRGNPGPIFLLAMTPWPLLAIFLRSAELPWTLLAQGQALVLGLALSIWTLGRTTRLGPRTLRTTLLAMIQAATILALAVIRP